MDVPWLVENRRYHEDIWSILVAVPPNISDIPESSRVSRVSRPSETSSQAQVRLMGQEVIAYPEDVDVLINNAAIMAVSY